MNSASFRNKLARNLSTYRKVLVNEGLFPCLECFVRSAGAKVLGMSSSGTCKRVAHPRVDVILFRATDVFYDFFHKVDTGGVIDLPEMAECGKNYVGTPPRAWKLLLRRLPIDPLLFTYVDFGCGKGRTLLLASEMGFRRIIGVDISQQLLDVARQNMERKNVNGELACCDVREFDLPNEPLVLFMYNPFYPDVMERVAENLKRSICCYPREVYVVYYSAALKDVWRKLDFAVYREGDYAYPNYVIYRAGLVDAAQAGCAR